TNEKARRLSCDLRFLAPGQWRAEIFRDGASASPAWTTKVVMEDRVVDNKTVLTLDLNAAGGQAVLLTPVETA
ncbi:MAG TPA: glycoside hydrolase family 97 C-terminal domain-containing protein, partial [Asticcacaulis sp.]|nr:glycoside hydrolase family 97 C-terminal domain-containing protein [Asticcacaulis sp.]